jgi:hypothetical protein
VYISTRNKSTVIKSKTRPGVERVLMLLYRKPNSVSDATACEGLRVWDNHLSGMYVAIHLKRFSAHAKHGGTTLHRGKDLAVALSSYLELHPFHSCEWAEPLYFYSGVTVRTSGRYPDGRYPLPFSPRLLPGRSSDFPLC